MRMRFDSYTDYSIEVILHCPVCKRVTGNPVSGMPILNVDQAKSAIVIKRSMGHGYAGIDNELYIDPKTGMFFSDAKAGLAEIIASVKALVAS